VPDRPEHLLGAFVNEQLYAVANYGIGANMDGGKSLAAMTGLPVTRDNHVPPQAPVPHRRKGPRRNRDDGIPRALPS
jgi:hypothetical protein